METLGNTLHSLYVLYVRVNCTYELEGVVVQAYLAELERSVSMPRLSKYRPQSGSDLETAVNYFWNIELSESLYPGLAALEVTLRSSIHDALTAREGADMWFRKLLEPGQLRGYAETHYTLFNRLKQKPPTSGQIVAELTFGFWTTLLSQPYHQTLWAPQKSALVKVVFPHLPRIPNNRHFIHQRYNDLRMLRNRVMHHEPIWYRPNLSQEWEGIIEAIGWISPTTRDSILLIDHFEDTYHNGKARVEADICQRFGI